MPLFVNTLIHRARNRYHTQILSSIQWLSFYSCPKIQIKWLLMIHLIKLITAYFVPHLCMVHTITCVYMSHPITVFYFHFGFIYPSFLNTEVFASQYIVKQKGKMKKTVGEISTLVSWFCILPNSTKIY